MAPAPILRALWRRKFVVLHIIVIASLIAISIWDSALIIRTFINDNRVTEIHTGDGKDSPIHFENITLEVYNMDSVLPIEWSDELNISDFPTSIYHEEIVKKILTGELNLSSIDISTTEGKVHAVSLFSHLRNIDSRSLSNCLIRGQHDCAQMSTDYGNLSRILRNDSELVKLQEILFSELRNALAFIWRASEASIEIRDIWINGLTFEIATGMLLSNASMFSGALRLNNKLRTHQHQNGSGFDGVSVAIVGGRSLVTLELDPNSYNHIVIDVKNLGIYDKSKTTKCTRDPEIHSPVDLTAYLPDCDHSGRLKAVVKNCGCIPFVTEHIYHRFESAVTDLPFCDLQRYHDCSTKHGSFGNYGEKCNPLCITIRNQYTVHIVRLLQCNEKNKDRCTNVFFSLTSNDRSFVIYDDRYQLTIPQFLSQLGGDIGLYTGLSLLSLWQILLVTYLRYKEHVSRSSANGLNYAIQFLVDQMKTARAFVIHSQPAATDDRDDRDSMERQQKEVSVVLHQQPLESNDNHQMAVLCRSVREISERIEQLTHTVDEIRRSGLEHSSRLEALEKKAPGQKPSDRRVNKAPLP